MIIGNKTIGGGQPIYIIAEAGVNHNGELASCFSLIDAAKDSGADAVKFQNFKADELILKNVPRARYQKLNTKSNNSQYEMLKGLELTLSDNKKIRDYCAKKGIEFLSTPFDLKGLEELIALEVSTIKISSTDINNPWLIEKICKYGKPIILSTGMSYLTEVDKGVSLIKSYKLPFCVLQCSTDYPLCDKDVNLLVISEYIERYDVPIGFSDHSVGNVAALGAAALGAKVIEKHFTMDKLQKGPDHLASLEPDELCEYVANIKRVESMLGSNQKIPTLAETFNRRSMQKSIVAAKPIKKGEIFNADNLFTTRTGGVGIPAMYIKDLYGTSSSVDYKYMEIIDTN